MPIEAVKIPQNVYVEDRIIGPITLRQIMLVMISGGVSYAIWAIMQSNELTSAIHTAIAWTPCVLGCMFAFVRVNNISLFRIVLLSLEKLEKPSRRIWMPHRGIYINITTSTEPPKKENADLARKRRSHEEARLEELSEVLDQGPSELTGHYEGSTPDEPRDDMPVQNTQGPVNPSRIRAEERSTPASVDGIDARQRAAEPAAPQQRLLRDILPPPASHA